MDIIPDNKKKYTGVFRKILAGSLASFIVLGSVITVSPPQQAHALFGASWALVIKEFSLDGTAKLIAKRMLQMITQDTVNWINSGFNGSPGFITNPHAFATRLADTAFNDFLNRSASCTRTGEGGLNCVPLTAIVCSPFRVNLSVSLAQDHLYGPKYNCSINDVISNIGAFYHDFENGGWQAWFSMTQNVDSLPLGVYIQARDDLNLRVRTKNNIWQQEANWAHGLLSWKTCGGSSKVETIDAAGNVVIKDNPITPEECPPNAVVTNTPGSLIEAQVGKVFGSGVGELEVADEINEIIGALINQFTIKLFRSTTGLLGLKGNISSDPGDVVDFVSLGGVIDPSDVEVGDYCGSYRDGMLPTATLRLNGDTSINTLRTSATVVAGTPITYSWCGGNADSYSSVYSVSGGTACPPVSGAPWVANTAYGSITETLGPEFIGCTYTITYTSNNSAYREPLTGDIVSESESSFLTLRVVEPPPEEESL